MKKFKEVFKVANKVGWETEAWFDLKRTATGIDGSDSQLMLLENLGKGLVTGNPADDEDKGFEVCASWNGEVILEASRLSIEDATKLFESYLETK